MYNLLSRIVAVVVAVAMMQSPVSGIPQALTNRTMWTWNDPPAPDNIDPLITSSVRVKVFVGARGMTGVEAADAVCNIIQQRQLTRGRVNIHLQDFGKGDGLPGSPYSDGVALVYQTDDALEDQTVPMWWMTPYMNNGIAETSTWFGQFIDRYKVRQLVSPQSIPDPTRFHFDNEIYVTGCCSIDFVRNFHGVLNDPKATSPAWAIVGNDDGQGSPRTLAQLYSEYLADAVHGGLAPDPQACCIHTVEANRRWNLWYGRVCSQAVDKAMDLAVQGKIHAAWPGCLVSDYGQASLDGLTDPDLPPFSRRVVADPWQAGAFWANNWGVEFYDLQAPVFYPIHFDHRRPGESIFDASMRVHRHELESIIHSYGGGHAAEIVPWILLPGEAMDVGWYVVDGPDPDSNPDPVPYFTTFADIHRTMALLRSFDIGEYLLFNPGGGTASQWRDFRDVLNQVWAFDPVSVTVTGGEILSGDLASLRHALWDRLSILMPAGELTVTTQMALNLGSPRPARLRVRIEAAVDAGLAQLQVDIRDQTALNFWVPLGTVQLTSERLVVELASGPSASLFNIVGEADIRLRCLPTVFGAPQTLHIDLIQLTGLPPCPGDFNASGKLSVQDLFDYLAAYFSGEPRADFNDSGTISLQDLFDYLTAYFAGTC